MDIVVEGKNTVIPKVQAIDFQIEFGFASIVAA